MYFFNHYPPPPQHTPFWENQLLLNQGNMFCTCMNIKSYISIYVKLPISSLLEKFISLKNILYNIIIINERCNITKC